jgi:hypothetical protein
MNDVIRIRRELLLATVCPSASFPTTLNGRIEDDAVLRSYSIHRPVPRGYSCLSFLFVKFCPSPVEQVNMLGSAMRRYVAKETARQAKNQRQSCRSIGIGLAPRSDT